MVKTNNNRIFVTRSSIPTLEEYIEEIRPVFDNHILTNMGPVYQRFKDLCREYLQVPELSLFVNGHMALEMCIQAMGLKQKGLELGGGEVITTPFTFVSTAHAISRNNLKPVFCDIRKDDYCIDADKIEELITDKTVAILPVHVYGNICDVEKIESIARKYDLKVIYDGAHSFGELYKGKTIGNYGDATMFSFHATKVFNTIEGGAVAFKNKDYCMPLHELKNFGIHNEIDIPAIGGNAKMNEFCAAMGICNLRRIDGCIAARKVIHDRYVERLGEIDGITLCKPKEGIVYNYSYFPIYVDPQRFGKSRDDIYDRLMKEEIYTRKYFYPAVNELPGYTDCKGTDTPVAYDVSRKILTLPIYRDLTLEEVDMICDLILE